MGAGEENRPVTKQSWLKLVNTFFYSGMSPVMPGTIGTLASAPFAWWMHGSLPPSWAAGLVFVIVLASIFASHLYVLEFKSDDPSEVVIDEVCGYLVATLLLPMNFKIYALAFVIFRILDIIKPPPINLIDRRIGGGLGVVMDDVVAGLITNALVRAAIRGGLV